MLAARSGLTQSMISMIEKGARGSEMSLDTAWRLAWSLGTSLDWLAGMPVMRG
jgi:transcriptional regulator with XRE-family HTH domain